MIDRKANIDKNDLMLYAITDRHWLNKDAYNNPRDKEMSLFSQIEISLNSGVTMLQLREKNMSREEVLAEAIEINKLCKKFNVPLIINDDIEIAIKSGAAGVHLGQGDLNAGEARKLIPKDMILGVSAATIDEAKIAEMNGADYLGVGDIFGTSTKNNARHISPDILKKICESVEIPVVAIGGITIDNIMELKDTDAAGVAVISAIFSQKDIAKATKALKKKAIEVFY